MKLTLSILLLFTSFVFAQTHKATYSFKIEVNPVTGDSRSKDDFGPLAEANELYLYFNKENSYYTSYNVENDRKDFSDAIAGCYYPVKYNYKSKIYQYNTEFDKLYVYNEKNVINWTITNETKEISGYNCIKAIGELIESTNPNKKHSIEVWFTPELPYPIGPKNFTNLPGLVVYGVFNNFQIYKLEKIKYNDNTVDIDSIQFEGEEISEEKYNELMKEA